MAAATVDDYISEIGGVVAATLEAARRFILDTVPDIVEFMKWGAPAYRLQTGGQLFYLYGGKTHVNLGFILGDQLADSKGMLQGEGQKDSRHVHLDSPADITDNPAIADLLRQSVDLIR